MATSPTVLEKRFEKIEARARARKRGPKIVRHIVIEATDDIPEEAEGELLICRVIVDPPERPGEEPPVLPPVTSPRTMHGHRMAVPENFGRRLDYPKIGSHA
jgi:hypothetical protein